MLLLLLLFLSIPLAVAITHFSYIRPCHLSHANKWNSHHTLHINIHICTHHTRSLSLSAPCHLFLLFSPQHMHKVRFHTVRCYFVFIPFLSVVFRSDLFFRRFPFFTKAIFIYFRIKCIPEIYAHEILGVYVCMYIPARVWAAIM